MRKIVLLGIIFIGLFIVGLWLYQTVTVDTTDIGTPQPGGDFPTITTQPSTDGSSTISLQTKDGAVSVRNFLQDQTTVVDPINSGHHYLGNYIDPTVDTPPSVPYVIEYIDSTHFFNVSLLQEPLGWSRREAEAYLVNSLGIPPEQLCTLQYNVSTPNRVNKNLAGQNLGFSFCPGSFPLE